MTPSTVRALLALGACAALASTATQAATVERLVVLQGGENVGHVVGTTHGNRVSVDYRVDNNGRGPKLSETLRLDRSGIPLEWTVSGSSLMGGEVAESYRYDGARARWKSQADQGEAAAATAPVYIVNDDSPWATGVYARALLAAPGQRLDVLPAGTLRLEKLRDATVGSGAAAAQVTVYRLSGINLEPTLLMLDAGQRLFAQFSDGSVVVWGDGEERGAGLLKRVTCP